MKKLAILQSKNPDAPQFECPTCRFRDDIGMFATCPICFPLNQNCPFLVDRTKCGLDQTGCDFAALSNFNDCRKRDSQT